MEKREEFNAALKDAMKNKDAVALSTVRLIIAALKDRDITARGQGRTEGVGETEILSMLQSMIKQRNESVTIYREAGREDLAVREEQEIAVIERFLPKQLSDDQVGKEIEKLIAETGAQGIKDMGKVMAELKTRFAGQIDMGKAGAVAKKKLS